MAATADTTTAAAAASSGGSDNLSNLSPEPADFTRNAPQNLPSPPFIHVEGVPNFRDLGGYACAPSAPGGAASRVRTGLLYRCAQLSQITPAGTATLTSTLSIQTLYDLRSMPEIKALQARGHAVEIEGVTRHFTPVYEEEDYSPVKLATKYLWYTAPDNDDDDAGGASSDLDYSRGFVNAYRDIATNAGPAYRRILLHVRDRPREPCIFHCTAGKDRTGVLAGLLLRLCGVADDTIAWEYGITEPGLGSWRETIVQRLMRGGMGAATHGRGMDRAQAERICGSRAGNMRVFLREVVDAELGGVRAYLAKYCGFSPDDIERIRANLVEEGEPTARPVEIEPYRHD